MKRAEIIAMLAACKPLADRLAAQGIYIELTDADRAILAKFNQLALEDWLDDPSIAKAAGLHQFDINMLGFEAARAMEQICDGYMRVANSLIIGAASSFNALTTMLFKRR